MLQICFWSDLNLFLSDPVWHQRDEFAIKNNKKKPWLVLFLPKFCCELKLSQFKKGNKIRKVVSTGFVFKFLSEFNQESYPQHCCAKQ